MREIEEGGKGRGWKGSRERCSDRMAERGLALWTPYFPFSWGGGGGGGGGLVCLALTTCVMQLQLLRQSDFSICQLSKATWHFIFLFSCF